MESGGTHHGAGGVIPGPRLCRGPGSWLSRTHITKASDLLSQDPQTLLCGPHLRPFPLETSVWPRAAAQDSILLTRQWRLQKTQLCESCPVSWGWRTCVVASHSVAPVPGPGLMDMRLDTCSVLGTEPHPQGGGLGTASAIAVPRALWEKPVLNILHITGQAGCPWE